jgi:excinuclease ABC subunit A
MARADYLVEVGPGAGREGGHITAAGTPRRFLRSKALTARYLLGEERIPMPAVRRAGSGETLVVRGATQNNLQGVDLTLPLGTFTVITGVSGSGKSTLITQILARALAMTLNNATERPGAHAGIDGIEHLDKLVEIDQSPIGRTPRSNPATYTQAWEPIRALFAATPEARRRGYTKSRFSFNVDPERGGGRCEECGGAGVKVIEMQFLADVQVPCESCGGHRFDPETLEIRYKGRTISEILDMTVEQGAAFFANHKKIHRILDTLVSVGLTYISLGQPSTTLSGGEAQRIKLASELHRPATGRTLDILDEPTTGLHMADVRRLLDALARLVDAGNTVVVIEHNADVIKCADHIVDLGPEGGAGGGRIIATGTPEHIATQDSPTGHVLAEVLAAERIPAGVAEPAIPLSTRRRKSRPVDIQLRGVATHNLRGVDVDIPRGSMTVITGPSGSGKTSLAFDTLFSEGQRRYVESLSTYARRFLGRLQRAPVDSAEGLAPAIAIDQRNAGHNPRSTVATVTEIYDTYRLLYARIGRPHCPRCARPVLAQPPAVAARTLQSHSGAGWLVADLTGERQAGELMREGFARILTDGTERELTDPEEVLADTTLVIDRLNPARSSLVRLSDSISTAYAFGRNHARFIPRRDGDIVPLSRAPECPEHGPVLPEDLTPRHFSFNSHLGACTDCGGLGRRETVDPELLFPDPEGSFLKAMDARVASVLSRAPRTTALISAVFAHFGTDEEARTTEYSRPLRRALLYGLSEPLTIRYSRKWGSTTTVIEEERLWPGVVTIIEGWKGRATWLFNVATCPTCGGDRLKPELLSVRIGERPGRPPGLSIADASALTVSEALAFWRGLSLTAEESAIAEQALIELTSRLAFLEDVGLAYLTLDRSAETLSGGESQRIRLATQLGSRLTGTIYVLDEPTTGLHQRDTERLLGTLQGLKALGNTLVVVEHDPEVMLRADHIIDMGPGAGEHGGTVVAQGPPDSLGGGLTGRYLSGAACIPVPATRREPQGWLASTPSTLHNLKSATAQFPRGCITAVTGVSGSGKSTLVMDALRPQLEAAIAKGGRKALRIKGRGSRPRKLVVIDQKPIGRTPRSTPLTYCDLLTPLRGLFAQAPLARRRGYKPGRFSFNMASGRCTHCEGRGAVLVEMHFLSDVWIPCEECSGRRYNAETLEVRYKGVSIADVLDMTAEEALEIFSNHKKLSRTLTALCDVGLGYIRLGQPANTLSGGEAQRLKLASELSISDRAPETCFLLDEPTTGLHFSDVEKLLVVLHRLVDAGHMVVLIEHHLDVIRNADHIIDMGPEGGAGGGRIIATGTPEALIAGADETGSWTGKALKSAMAARPTQPSSR